MSYQVLARKWRPQVFEDVAGQGHITRTLQNAIVSGRLAHAFLFSGPRGVGKTTTARILAKALNCAHGPTPKPCGTCDSCLETTAGASVDVVEIDGASNRGIEHIRELREAVKYAPVGGKNKVYVIDEVHMLTNEAFNALLKTLEEPPPHVIFIFATTEPQKIPATIHSRCQRYGFKRVALHEIIERLRTIAGAERIILSDRGLGMIARAAEGSMRDSQSLLDQAVSYSGMEIKDDDLQAILGIVPQEQLLQFASGLLARDAGGLLRQVDALLERGQDMRQFLAGAVEHVRNLMIVKLVAEPGPIIELPAADIESIRAQAAGAGSDQLLMLFDSLTRTLEDLRWSPHQRFTLEAGLIKACSLAPLQPLAEVLGRMKELEARLATGKPQPASPGAAAHHAQRIGERPTPYTPAAQPASRPAAEAVPDHGHHELWDQVIAVLKTRKPGLFSALGHSGIVRVTDTELVIGFQGSGFQLGKIEEQESRGFIEQVVEDILHRKVRVKIQAAEAPVKAAAKPDTKPKTAKQTKPREQDPGLQDVLRAFPQAELIESEDPEA
jgi:DNA polymerase-3 subunit gamma/tau